MLLHFPCDMLVGDQNAVSVPFDISARADVDCCAVGECARYRCHKRLQLKAQQIARIREPLMQRRLLASVHHVPSQMQCKAPGVPHADWKATLAHKRWFDTTSRLGGHCAFPGGLCTPAVLPILAVRPRAASRPIEAPKATGRYVRNTSSNSGGSAPQKSAAGANGD